MGFTLFYVGLKDGQYCFVGAQFKKTSPTACASTNAKLGYPALAEFQWTVGV